MTPTDIPHYFGDYEIMGEIARGGMGIVYRARQTSLNRRVALKMIAAGPLASKDFIERFHVEAEACARLYHPNIVPIYEIGVHREQHFMAIPLLEGGSLADKLDQGEWPFHATPDQSAHDRLSAIATLVAKLARAVHHAHQRGILHRDLKPGNILFDQAGEPYVADFGLAKLVEKDSRLTQTGAFLGTPAYMAPEQAEDGAQVTTAADVYGLGAILYHLIAGRAPFRGATVMETLRQVATREPEPLRSDRNGVDLDLETICLKCLSKEAEARYDSALALAEDLTRWVNGETILARPTTAAAKVWRWCRREPLLSGLILTVLGLLIAVASVSTVAAFRLRQARIETLRAGQTTERELVYASLAQAQSERKLGASGWRARALSALRRAAMISLPPPSPEVALRNEAIACLASSDLTPLPDWPEVVAGPGKLLLDPPRDRYITAAANGAYSVRSMIDHQELVRLEKNAWDDPDRNLSAVDRIWAISPDGQWIAGRFEDGSLRFRRIAATRQIWQLNDSGRFAYGRTTFSPDGRRVAFPVSARRIRIAWILDNLKEALTIDCGGALDRFLWAPAGERIAYSFERAPEIRVVDTQSGESIHTAQTPGTVRYFAWRPDGKTLAIAVGPDFYLWSPAEERAPTLIGSVATAVRALTFSETGDALAVVATDGEVRVVSSSGGQTLLTTHVGGETERVTFIQHDRELAVTHGSPLRLTRWEISLGEDTVRMHRSTDESPGPAEKQAILDSRGLFARVENDGRVKLFSKQGEAELATLDLPGAFRPVTGLRWTSESSSLWVTQTNGLVWEWRIENVRNHLRSLKLEWPSP